MTEISFYHLTQTTLDEALPGLIEKSLARQWRVVIQTPDTGTCARIDDLLWSYEPMSFLPHGRDGDEPADAHPVYVTATRANPNGGAIRFVLGGSPLPEDLSGHERVAVMFDGNDDALVAGAREQWRTLKSGGHDLTYFRQTPEGRWEKAA